MKKGSAEIKAILVLLAIIVTILVGWLVFPSLIVEEVCVEEALGLNPIEGNPKCYCLVVNQSSTLECTGCGNFTSWDIENATTELGDVCIEWELK